ncbi:MAG: insulinase family protein, partial [Bacteroidales bacterium]|nr:insulinase family protein [Bacteroidales bacterium]
LHELVEETSIPDEEFAIYMNKRRQSLQANLQKTSCMARNLFFRSLFPRPHPYGDYALPVDADKVSAQDVRDFFHRCYRWNTARLVISGACHHLHWDKHPWLAETGLANTRQRDEERSFATTPTKRETLRHPVPGAVQSTIRIGRLLPFAWNDMQHARFLILNAILGGYFGSRLMSNLREDKGYTYSIYSRVQIMRGATVFSLSTDVNAEATDNALKEIYGEMRRLREEPVPTDELETVKNYLAGEFLRGIDGVFERSERFIQQEYALVDDRLDANYLQALSSVTPQQLQELACEFLREDELTEVVAGR